MYYETILVLQKKFPLPYFYTQVTEINIKTWLRSNEKLIYIYIYIYIYMCVCVCGHSN